MTNELEMIGIFMAPKIMKRIRSFSYPNPNLEISLIFELFWFLYQKHNCMQEMAVTLIKGKGHQDRGKSNLKNELFSLTTKAICGCEKKPITH